MANTCENILEIIGDKKEVEAFMKNVLEVEGGGVEYQIPGGDEILPFGWLQNRVEDSIVFDSNWSVPVENIEAMSKLHPALTFSVTYTIPNDEVAGITVIKNAAYLRDEEDDISSDLARELLGSEYVDSLLDEDICKNYLELEGDKEEITLCMANIFETENNEVIYKVEKKLTGKGGLLAPLIKQLTEAALEAEVESHIANDVLSGTRNRRNGSNRKTIKGTSDGTFEPQIVKKHQTTISDEIEEKVLSMYGLGMSYRDISSHIEDIYQVSISTATISLVTDKIISKVKEWQARPLEAIYPFVWLDAIHYKIKEDGRYISKAVYTILGVNLKGKKEVLGLYISENEGANFWLQVLTDLQNRGVEDILIASVDGLSGFPQAINSIFPETQVQLCIVHQIRNHLNM